MYVYWASTLYQAQQWEVLHCCLQGTKTNTRTIIQASKDEDRIKWKISFSTIYPQELEEGINSFASANTCWMGEWMNEWMNKCIIYIRLIKQGGTENDSVNEWSRYLKPCTLQYLQETQMYYALQNIPLQKYKEKINSGKERTNIYRRPGPFLALFSGVYIINKHVRRLSHRCLENN